MGNKFEVTDMTGQRFGRLTVVGPDGAHKPGQKAMWICKCDCGNETSVQGKMLRNGAVSSCGCLQRETRSQNAEKARDFHNINVPTCSWEQKTCFAYDAEHGGTCKALNDTRFPTRLQCPFYKDRGQHLMEMAQLDARRETGSGGDMKRWAVKP